MKAPSKCFVIKEMLRMDFEKTRYLLKQKFSSANGVSLDLNFSIPDSRRITEVIERGNEIYDPAIAAHCIRSYFFGKIFANIEKKKIDDEVFFAGSFLHDIGLNQSSSSVTFEVAGANCASQMCQRSFSTTEISIISEMISLHDAIGMANSGSSELRFLHMGAGLDVAGLWSYLLPEDLILKVYREAPANNFSNTIISLLKERMREHPKMFLSTLIRLGFYGKIKKWHREVLNKIGSEVL